MQKVKHGGYRVGAGRKQIDNKASSVVVRVPEAYVPLIRETLATLKNNHRMHDAILKTIRSSTGQWFNEKNAYIQDVARNEVAMTEHIALLDAELIAARDTSAVTSLQAQTQCLQSELFEALNRLREIETDPNKRW